MEDPDCCISYPAPLLLPLALIMTLLSVNIPGKIQIEIANPFSNFNSYTVWEWQSTLLSHFYFDL